MLSLLLFLLTTTSLCSFVCTSSTGIMYVSALTTTRGHHHHHHHIMTTSSPTTSSLPAHNSHANQNDWAQYSLRQSYKKAGGILYKQSLLTPIEFISVQSVIIDLLQNNLKLTNEKESSFATNRIGAVISEESDVYRILSCREGSLCRLVNGLVDDEDDDGSDEEELGAMILSPNIPIEVSL